MILPITNLNQNINNQILTENNQDYHQKVDDVFWIDLSYVEYPNVIYGEFMLNTVPTNTITLTHTNVDGSQTESATPQYQDGIYSFVFLSFYIPSTTSSYYQLESIEIYDGDNMIDDKNVAITNFNGNEIVSDLMINYLSSDLVIFSFIYDYVLLDRAEAIGYQYNLDNCWIRKQSDC